MLKMVKQPMSATYNENTYTIVYNGQVYKCKRYKKKILQDLGYNFTGYCDTEVILKGFIHYGKTL